MWILHLIIFLELFEWWGGPVGSTEWRPPSKTKVWIFSCLWVLWAFIAFASMGKVSAQLSGDVGWASIIGVLAIGALWISLGAGFLAPLVSRIGTGKVAKRVLSALVLLSLLVLYAYLLVQVVVAKLFWAFLHPLQIESMIAGVLGGIPATIRLWTAICGWLWLLGGTILAAACLSFCLPKKLRSKIWRLIQWGAYGGYAASVAVIALTCLLPDVVRLFLSRASFFDCMLALGAAVLAWWYPVLAMIVVPDFFKSAPSETQA